MQVLTVRPIENHVSDPLVYFVEHDDLHREIGTDYEIALLVVKHNSSSWALENVIKELENMGWDLLLINSVHKGY